MTIYRKLAGGGGFSGRLLTPSSSPAVGIIYSSPLNTCFSPETLESPTQDDFPFPSCLQPYLLLSRPRQVLSNYCGLQEPDNPELLRPVATRASNSISYLFKLPPLLSLDELNLQSRKRTQIENKHMDINRGLEERGRLGLPYTHYYV